MAANVARRSWCGLAIATALAGSAFPAEAQTTPKLAEVTAEIEALERQQLLVLERITELRRELATARGQQRETSAAPSPTAPADALPPNAGSRQGGKRIELARTDPAAPINPAGGSAPGPVPTPVPGRLTLNGDLRLRYEANSGDRNARDRDRGVLRARLRAGYAVTDWLTVGGQLATGDPDDPNSTDVTLSNFDDDIDASLDQIYARMTLGNLQLFGGKIPQPFVRTELVWDGDVNPEGIGATLTRRLGGTTLRANALYFLVDESVAGPNSDMVGAQLGLEANPARALRVEFAVAYLDYSLRSLAGADAGDIRSNRFANGRYLSDFNLVDLIGAATYSGLGERWPVRLVGDYVHNLGASVADDSGFGLDLLVGRIARKRDWRFAYGYAQTGVDAVLDAFSHDNTTLGSNYLQHSFAVDYVAATNVILNATYYRYRAKSAQHFLGDATDWLNRLRLNLLINF